MKDEDEKNTKKTKQSRTKTNKNTRRKLHNEVLMDTSKTLKEFTSNNIEHT